MKIKSFRDLKVWQKAFALSCRLYELTRSWPKEERYSLIDQTLRSSRSVSGQIAEGWAKRMYPKAFKVKMVDAMGEAQETQNWLDYALQHGYLDKDIYHEIDNDYQEIISMLWVMHNDPERFLPKSEKDY